MAEDDYQPPDDDSVIVLDRCESNELSTCTPQFGCED